MFVKRGSNGNIPFIMIKLTDEIFFAGQENTMKEFVRYIKSRFEVSKTIINPHINFNGSRTSQDKHGNISLSMDEYAQSIEAKQFDETRRKKYEDNATEAQFERYRSLAGSMIWPGHGALLQAAFVVSYMQQNFRNVRVKHIVEANKMFKQFKDLSSTIWSRKTEARQKEMEIWNFSDASLNIGAGWDYGQTGEVTIIMVQSEENEKVIHIVHWKSRKQKRASQ